MREAILLDNISKDDLLAEIREIVNQVVDSKLKVDPPKQFISKRQVAEKLGVSLPTVSRLVSIGRITGYRVGRRLLFRPEEVESALNLTQQRNGSDLQ